MSARTVTVPAYRPATQRGEHPVRDGQLALECEYVSASGMLGVSGDPRHGWRVYHLPSGLEVPTGIGSARWPADYGRGYSAQLFRLKTAARDYMRAIEAAGILTMEDEQSPEIIGRLKNWMLRGFGLTS